MGIGERLKEERLRLGLSQPALGAIGGVGKQAQLRYEAEERSPDSKYLAAIAAAGVDVLYILTGQRAGGVAPASAMTEGDRILLDNFHHAPEQVQAGIKTTLGAFAPTTTPTNRGGGKKAA